MSAVQSRRIPVSQFKARCLRLLDDVRATGRGLVVTKHGRPLAMVVPVTSETPDLKESVKSQGDIVSPLDEDWDVER